MMGRPASGRARKASMSFPRSATTTDLSWRHSGTRVFAWTRNPEVTARDSGFVLRTPRNDGTSGAGVEERRQPGRDVFRNLVGGAILGSNRWIPGPRRSD